MKLPRLKLRERLASVVEMSGAATPILRARATAGAPWLTVLTYHRVRAEAHSGGFDDGVVDATTDAFDEQLGRLARHFSFVTIEDVRRWVRGGSLPKNPVLISFDDAYLECRSNVLPILQRHGATASFFVSTQHVKDRTMFWWDRASYVIGKSKIERATVPGFDFSVDFTSDPARANTLRRALRKIKDTYGLDIDAFLAALTKVCEVEWSAELERKLADSLIMNWDDIRAMRKAGMDVQSHTRTHRVLQTLSAEELTQELRGSREDLEHELGEKITALAYPTGRPIRTRGDIGRAVRDAGYDLAFENVGGINTRFLKPSPLNLRRIPMEGGISPERFEAILVLPYLQ